MSARCRTVVGIALRGAVLILAATHLVRAATPGEDPDWPCVQRKVPEISAGMMWAGPPVDALQTSWRDDDEVAALAPRIAARRMPMEQAEDEIAAFAEAAGDDKERRLTLLFAALLDLINRERNEIVAGLDRVGRRQAALSERIHAAAHELQELRGREPSEQRDTRIAELEQQLAWDTRIYDERRLTVSYVCESPVLLEQRLFALARAIQSQLP